jgi:hypothetical protein
LANEKRSASPPKEICWVQPFIAVKKQKKTESKSKDAQRKMHKI